MLTACAGGVQQLIDGDRQQYVLDPSFDLFNLQQADIYFADFHPLADMGDSYAFDDIAYRALLKSRPDLRWHSHHQFEAFAGVQTTDLRQKALKNFEGHQSLLAAIQQPSSYVLFVRMLDTQERLENNEEQRSDDQNNRVIVREYRAIREGTAQADIYDLSTQQRVWSALIDHSVENVETTERQRGSVLENVLSDAVDTLLVMPQAPSQSELIEAMFKRLGGMMPQKACSQIGWVECMKRSTRQN